MTPTFKCHKLNNQMSVSRCLANQAKGLALFGPNAGKYQTCPCDQGIKIKEENQMGTAAVKKHCEDCGRTIYNGRFCSACATKIKKRPLVICKECGREMPHQGQGMCGKCYSKLVRRPKLRAAKEKAKTTEPAPIYDPFLDAPVPDPKPEKFVVVPVKAKEPEPAPVLSLPIADDLDRKVLEFINSEARRCRRTPEQQAMWMLQSHLPESTGEAA